jgi:hypothetical protein
MVGSFFLISCIICINFRRIMMGSSMKVILFVLSTCGAYSAQEIQTTEVFMMPLEVNTFNWGSDRSVLRNRNGFWFRPTIAGAPDLPQWLSYAYSERNKSGFLYGVPPDLSTNYKVSISSLLSGHMGHTWCKQNGFW